MPITPPQYVVTSSPRRHGKPNQGRLIRNRRAAIPYTNFADLAASEAEGVDFRREHTTVTGSGWLAMAVHGGRIEATTAEMAAYVASTTMSYYGFIGTKAANNFDLHITSSQVDYPDLLAMMPQAHRVLSFHGMTGTLGVAETAVGGLDEELVTLVRDALQAAGFTVIEAPAEVAGTNTANICNRGITRRGCQIEMSRTLRESFAVDGNIDAGSLFEAGQRSATFFAYGNALLSIIHPTLLTYDQPTAKITIAGPAVGLLDTFVRNAETEGWNGPTDSGHHWNNSGGATTDHTVSGGLGRMRLAAVNSSRWANIPVGSSDWDVTADVATDVLALGGSHFNSIAGRWTDTDNTYLARLEFTTAQVVNLTIRKRVGGSESLIGTTFNTGLTHTANGFIRLRFRGSGTTLKAKAWLPGSLEPADWMVEQTDTTSTPPTTGDQVAVRSILSSSNSNVLPVFSTWTNISTNGRTVLQRSRDGISWTDVRGGTNLGPAPTDISLYDWEFAANTANYYRTRQIDEFNDAVLVEGDQEFLTPTLTVSWLKSPTRPFLNQVVEFGGDELIRERPPRGGSFDVVGRSLPIGVTDVRSSRRYSVVFRTDTADQAQTLEYLIASGDILFFHGPACRVPSGVYWLAGQTADLQPLPDDPWHLTSLEVTEMAAPGADVGYALSTWQTVLNSYATWADLLADNPTWADLIARIAPPSEVIVP